MIMPPSRSTLFPYTTLFRSYIERLQAQEIIAAQQNGFEATSDFSRTKEVDALIICVPTPLNVYREPDLSYVENTLASILPYFKAGQLLSLESTTWPGTTEEILAPALKSQGFIPGEIGRASCRERV